MHERIARVTDEANARIVAARADQDSAAHNSYAQHQLEHRESAHQLAVAAAYVQSADQRLQTYEAQADQYTGEMEHECNTLYYEARDAAAELQSASAAKSELVQEANAMMQEIADKTELRKQDLHRQCTHQVQVQRDLYTEAVTENQVVKAKVAALEHEAVMLRMNAQAVPRSAAAAPTVNVALPKATRLLTPESGVGFRIKSGWTPAPGLVPPVLDGRPPRAPTTFKAPQMSPPSKATPQVAPPQADAVPNTAGPVNFDLAKDDGSTCESDDEAYQRRRTNAKAMVIENLPNAAGLRPWWGTFQAKCCSSSN